MKKLLLLMPIVMVLATCTQMKKQVVKDIPMQEQLQVLSEYQDRSAWTRAVLEDVGDKGSIPRDTKVKILDIKMQFQGSVTVETIKQRKRIVHSLELDEPLTPDKVREKLAELFWFKDPTLRQVDYIRKWGKKVARAIRDHEVFVGMPAAAAEESWGVPGKKNINEVGGKRNEQWVYPVGKRSKYIYIIDDKVSKWED